MPISGIVCGFDGSFQPFQHCIDCHEQFCPRSCQAPVELLKIMRDNDLFRKDAGLSTSTLTQCSRAVAMLDVYDYYEPLNSGWNKARGTWVHAMMESDPDPPAEVIRERRLYKDVHVNGKVVRITGKPDKVYSIQGVLIDFKSKADLPKGPDASHVAQFNVYAWLLNGGTFMADDEHPNEEPANIKIVKGGMHYLTWKTKEPFKKFGYEVWPTQVTERFVIDRLTPLVQWRETGRLPSCNPYVLGRWVCDCIKIATQLTERGIEVEEYHATVKEKNEVG